MDYLKTSDIAKIAGVHPNTVRNYERWGLISAVPRAQNGYRMFSHTHLDQVILVTMAFKSTWLVGEIRENAMEIIHQSAKLELEKALQEAKKHLELIVEEKKQAEEAIKYLENYSTQKKLVSEDISLSRTQAAELLGLSIHTLRDWERNGLLIVPRNPNNNYRIYGQEEIDRLKMIRLLRRARYSIMSILRMLTAFDQGRKNNFSEVLTDEDQDIFYATDTWLTTLGDLEENARKMIAHLKKMNPPV